MSFLALIVAAALLGGLRPALASAALGSLLLNFFFAPPLHRFTTALRFTLSGTPGGSASGCLTQV
ncbi:DUF4118 domain-containing protein [Streptomyces erythrochromogenes]|uniref:DUF4118 domain-containing protein n=1 Tax=Streptomyces erythrochromogenes TaxID=285574 RepID=UPI00368E6993